MLYISRRINYLGADYSVQDDSALRFGVVDTDDWAEEIVGLNALKAISSAGDIKIFGLSNPVRSTRDVHPYQPNPTPFQTKLNMLKGVSVAVNNDVIVDINYDVRRVTSPVRLRLSDFASECGDYILYGVEVCTGHKLTLVLDDTLIIRETSFEVWPFVGPDGIGVVFDMRELTNLNTLNLVYKTVFRSLEAYDTLCFSVPVIDYENRIIEMNKRYSGQMFKRTRWG